MNEDGVTEFEEVLKQNREDADELAESDQFKGDDHAIEQQQGAQAD